MGRFTPRSTVLMPLVCKTRVFTHRDISLAKFIVSKTDSKVADFRAEEDTPTLKSAILLHINHLHSTPGFRRDMTTSP